MTTDKLKKLLERCKCGVFITVNEHKNYYRSAADHIEEMSFTEDDAMSDEMKEKMIALDTIIRLHFYPETPIGSYVIIDCDLESALYRALQCLELQPPFWTYD